MKKATLTMPKPEQITMADYAARFLMTKSLPKFFRLEETLSLPDVRESIEANLAPVETAKKAKKIDEVNLLELVGVAKSDDSGRKALNGVLVEFKARRIAATDGRRLMYLDNAPQDFIELVRSEFARLLPDMYEKKRLVWKTDKRGNQRLVESKQPVEAKSCILKNVSKEARKCINEVAYDEFVKDKLQYMGEIYEFVEQEFPNYKSIIPDSKYAKGEIPDIWEKQGYTRAGRNLLCKYINWNGDVRPLGYDVVGGADDGVEAAFNPDYLLDAIDAFETLGLEPKTFYFGSGLPILMRGGDLGYVLMPMRGYNEAGQRSGTFSVSRMTAEPIPKEELVAVEWCGKPMPPCFLPDCDEPAVEQPTAQDGANETETTSNGDAMSETEAANTPETAAVAWRHNHSMQS